MSEGLQAILNDDGVFEEYDDTYDLIIHCKSKEEQEMAIKALEQEPCEDAISRSDAIRVASGYCHWSNIPKELEKLPSVNPIPCEDAISRQAALEGLATIALKVAKSDAQKAMMGRTMFFVERLPSVSTGKTDAYKQGWHDAIETALKEVYIIQQYDDIFRVVQEETLIGVGMAYEQVSTEKTGRWIDDEFGCKCSCCGIHTHLDKFDRPMKFKHCSMCGAKMVEPQESEDEK